jgi:hypothetical protein
MCFSQPAPQPYVPDNAAAEQAKAAEEARQKLRQNRANAQGVRSTINTEGGFLGVSDEGLSPTEYVSTEGM